MLLLVGHQLGHTLSLRPIQIRGLNKPLSLIWLGEREGQGLSQQGRKEGGGGFRL